MINICFWLLGLLAERHDDSELKLDNEMLPGTDPFSPTDNSHTEVGQDDDEDDDYTMPTNNMSSLVKSLQVRHSSYHSTLHHCCRGCEDSGDEISIAT